MIEKVLEAYEARTVGKENFRQRFRKMDRITQIAFWGSILGGIKAFGIAIVIMMLCIKYAFFSLKQLIELLSWNRIEKEKNFVLKLQDLLDRDFVIEQSDILKEQ